MPETAPTAAATSAPRKALAFLTSAPSDGARRVLIVGRVIVIGVTVVLLALLGRVVQLQVKPPGPIAALRDSQTSGANLMPRRANLLDARGRVIAGSRAVPVLFVDPQVIEDPGTFSEMVGYNLDFDPAWVEQTIAKRAHSRFVVLDEKLSDERLTKLSDLKLAGLATTRRLVRDYPQGPLAGPVIGFVGDEGVGLEGLEKTLDQRLRGESGRIEFLRDARRRPIWVEHDAYRPPADGSPVRLSLDIAIQQIAEDELTSACKQYQAKSGELVVLDVRNGAILAMANYPNVDPNQFGATPPDHRRNRCVTDVYEPGSIFKAFMWAAMTDAGFARPEEMIDTTESGFYVSPQGRRLRDTHGHGTISWEEVLVVSSNIGMAVVGQRAGATKLHEFLRNFGFGAPTGSGLPGEVGGIITPLKKFNHYSVTSVPMGQEVGVTALQLAAAFAAIANDGVYTRPTFLDPSDPAFVAPPRRRVISSRAAAVTRHALHRVITDGTGRKARSDLYRLFGKTGTAQVANPTGRGYLPDAYVGSFIAAAPLDNPQVVILCSVHQPDRSIGYYGGTVAAPPVKRVMEQTLLYLGVPPDPQAGAELAQNRPAHTQSGW